MVTLQLPEGYTVRKVGNTLKVIPQRKRKVAIVKKEDCKMPVTITHKCGHTQQFGGPATQDQAYMDAKRERYCINCEMFFKKVGLLPIDVDALVELQGSEKQVNWAVKIRKDFIEIQNNNLQNYKHRGTSADDLEKFKRIMTKLINEKDQAKWWIDNRLGERRALASAFQEELAKESEVLK
jgi:hypothetical protein